MATDLLVGRPTATGFRHTSRYVGDGPQVLIGIRQSLLSTSCVKPDLARVEFPVAPLIVPVLSYVPAGIGWWKLSRRFG
jgi:hypothetical protein